MSGGSYDYLYLKDSILGEVDGIEEMVKALRTEGVTSRVYDNEWRDLTDDETQRVLTVASQLESFCRKVRALEPQGDLWRDVLKAIEWWKSCDWGIDSVLKVAQDMKGCSSRQLELNLSRTSLCQDCGKLEPLLDGTNQCEECFLNMR